MKRFAQLVMAAVVLMTFVGGIAAEDATLKVGDAAPDFTIPEGTAKDQIGDAKKLSDLKGKNVVLAFFPKVFTGGCTKQMCGYRDDFSSFESADTVILAISVDPQSESTRFKDEHKLPFAVVGDPNREIVNTYGVEILKRGEVEYTKRETILIDKEGKIAYLDRDYHYDNGKQPLMDAITKANEAK